MQRKINDEMRLATVSQTAPTQAPILARADGSRKAWRSRGAAAGVIALALGLTACGGGSDDPAAPPVAVEEPAPVPPPVAVEEPAPVPPPVAVDPTPAGFVKTVDIFSAANDDVGDKFTKDARTIVYDKVHDRYYELVTAAAPLIYTDAKAAAVTAGGALASPSDVAKMTFVKQAFGAGALPGGTGVTASGSNGAWIGLEQTGTTSPTDTWTFLDGKPLAADSTLWNVVQSQPDDAGASGESGLENYGALFYGMTDAETDVGMIYDAGMEPPNSNPTHLQPMYLIEYLTKDAIK